MKKLYLLWALSACIVVGLSGCAAQSGHDEDEDEHAHEAGETHAPGEVVFKKTMADAVGLKTIKVAPGEFSDVIKATGRIVAAQGGESVVVATASGVVNFGKLAIVDGMAVRKGQPLLSLSSSNLAEGNGAAKAHNAYEAAQKEYERVQSLVKDRIVSSKEYEQARLNYENAKVAWQAVAGKQTASGVSVASTMSGYLKNIQVKEGDYVAVGQPLMTITQSNRLVLRAEVSEKNYNLLPSVRSANFRTPYDDAVYRLSDLNGKLLSFGKASDSDSFYLPVSFEFDNKGAIIPGSFVEVYLLTAPVQNVISVPEESLIEEQGLYSVYVRLDEDCFMKHPVTLGADNGKEVQILSGIKAGDEVVTEGAHQIKLASASNVIPPHSHHH